MAKKPINHKKEFRRNRILIGKRKKGYCSISQSLFDKFQESWEDRRK